MIKGDPQQRADGEERRLPQIDQLRNREKAAEQRASGDERRGTVDRHWRQMTRTIKGNISHFGSRRLQVPDLFSTARAGSAVHSAIEPSYMLVFLLPSTSERANQVTDAQ
ncbi:hypothetical protein ACVI55_006248 [Sinorhizobium medicae]